MNGRESIVTKERHPDWYFPVPNMHTLILGTFPPHIERWDFPFYYPNNVNQFWRVLARVGGVSLKHAKGESAVRERKQLMERLRVGVQNVGLVIKRKGKSARDADIVILDYQDINGILDGHETLKRIHLAGYSDRTNTVNATMKYFDLSGIKHTKPKENKAGNEFIVYANDGRRPITCIIGNSTSPAARIAGVTFEMLVEQFRRTIAG